MKIINIQRAQILQQKIKKLLNLKNNLNKKILNKNLLNKKTLQENSKQNNQTTNTTQEQTKPQTTAKETKKNTNTVVKKKRKQGENYLIQHQTVLQ